MSDTSAARRRPFYNVNSVAFQHNPFPTLADLRTHDPVHLTPQGWLVLRYDDCIEVLTSHSFGMHGIDEMLEAQMGPGPAHELIANRFHSFDPPTHARLRRLVAQAFSVSRVERMRKHVHAIADDLLDRVGTDRSFDVVEKLAYPLPSIVIAEMLGIPAADRAELNEWTDAVLALQGMAQPDPVTLAGGNRAAADLIDRIRRLTDRRRESPGDDVLSALIAAEENGDRLTPEEIVYCVAFLSNAGFSTTRNQIGNALVALLHNRDQWTLLLDGDQELVRRAVIESLRYNCSLTSTPRFAQQDVVIGNRRIRAGAPVFCLLNAANRDPERFPDPDRFDLHRDGGTKHVAFGGGVHFCLGARLAQLQIEVALSALIRRYPGLRLDSGRIEWRSGLYRGPRRLPVLS